MNWFKKLTGFDEVSYVETQRQLIFDGNAISGADGILHSVGSLEILSLAELRKRISIISPAADSRLRVSNTVADTHYLHADPDCKGALFQVASQFNLLEMPSFKVTPEDGITAYEYDRTQGPACAMAAGYATIYRNYLLPFPDGLGQTNDRQVNTFSKISKLIGADLFEFKNGYVLSSSNSLSVVNNYISGLNQVEIDGIRELLQIGLHSDVEVTAPGEGRGQFVSQALCSALPVSYNESTHTEWEKLACIVLEAVYEATLLAGVINSLRPNGSRKVYLTMVGGGAFGNRQPWILKALERALCIVQRHDLEIIIVSYSFVSPELHELAWQYNERK